MYALKSVIVLTLLLGATAYAVEDAGEVAASNKRVKAIYEGGDYFQAISLATNALKQAEKICGASHELTAEALHNLANLHRALAKFPSGAAYYNRALEIRENAVNRKNATVADTLCDLGELYRQQGDYTNAQLALDRALKLSVASAGSNHLDTARALHFLGMLYTARGDYSHAEPVLQQSLAIREEKLSPEQADIASSLNAMGELRRLRMEYRAALVLFKRALAINEKLLGPNHPTTGSSLNFMGVVRLRLGDYPEAEDYLRRGLKTREGTLGRDHPDVAISVQNLALVSMRMGDYGKAASLYDRALKSELKVLGREHRTTTTTLLNIARLCLETRNYPKATEYYEEVWKTRSTIMGPDNPEAASALSGLAEIADKRKDYQRAESLLRQVLEINEKTFGRENPGTAACLGNLGRIYRDTGEFQKAEEFFGQALALQEKLLGEDSSDTVATLTSLAILLLDEHDWARAGAIAERERKARLAELASMLGFASERERLLYENKRQPYSLLGSCSNAPKLTLAILQNKATVLDSILEDRLLAEASTNPAERASLDELQAAKERLAEITLNVPPSSERKVTAAYSGRRVRALERVEQLEGSLARKVVDLGRARRALSVTTKQVQAALPKHAALIEFLRYPHYTGNDKWVPFMGAAIVPPTGEPRWICFGPASPIEFDITLYQAGLRRHDEQGDMPRICSELYRQIWAPLGSSIPPGTTTVILSPDAGLNFISFATLLTPDKQFLAEKFALRYVATGRDLLPTPSEHPNHEMFIFANPDYNAGSLGRQRSENDIRPLKQSEKEAAVLECEAKAYRWPTHVYLGAEASEFRARSLQSPGILHFSTHGLASDRLANPFSLSGFTPNRQSGNPRFDVSNDPMLSSGIVLAGAQATLDAWKRGQIPPTSTDGILSAFEVASLHLNGTWLVTLSACDTGIGSAVGGEGVLGLRRSFSQAGAQNLLFTLWPVLDLPTYEFMAEFYSDLHKTGDPARALAEVQKSWLTTLRKRDKTEAAIYLAGAFVLSSRGIPK